MNDTLPEKACTTKYGLISFKQHGGDISALAKFTKASRDSIRRWNKGRLPNAETLLRLQYFLILNNYSLIEFQKINSWLYKLGQCIVFDLVTSESVTHELGLAEQKSLFRYFQGGSGFSSEKLKIFENICNRHETELQQKLSGCGVASTTYDVASQAALIKVFDKACEDVRRLGNQMLNGPIEGRVQMRQIMGQGNEPPLHLTWEVLNRLLKEPFVKLQ